MPQHQYATAFKRQWYIIAIGAIVGLIAGFGLSGLATPVYTATSSLYFSLNFGGSAQDLSQGSTYTQNQMLSFAQLATSPIVLQQVIQHQDLAMTPADLANMISVSTPQNTVILELSVNDADPAEAASIANSVAADLGQTVEQIAPKTATGAPTVSVRVIERATTPLTPSSPNVRLNLLAGFVIGLLVGVLVIVLKELLDTRVRSADTLTRLTGLPLLASIQTLRRHHRGAIVLDEPLSAAAEGYRRLRSSLEFVSIGSDKLAFVITSSAPGEGKSLTALNLALALLEGERKVLLVDADLRRPTIATATGLLPGAGLTSLLVGRATLEDVVQHWNGLDVLTSGPIPPNPSELLSSRAMALFLEKSRKDYDIVVFDSPPMTAVIDAAIIGRAVDGALVIVDRASTKRHKLSQTIELLGKSGVSVLGLVLNRVRSTGESSYYYAGASESPSWWRRRTLRRARPSAPPLSPLAPAATEGAEADASADRVDDSPLDDEFEDGVDTAETDLDLELAEIAPAQSSRRVAR
ncbi:polysaccharide biosynthesis tyrosine autokinase [Leifsonia sp. L25]|uniref:polysaccharide biosynthesis tyrosine autokinase n=1 Tax=Actinomycetes TaxID=1760 RepID=UPI003D687FCD